MASSLIMRKICGDFFSSSHPIFTLSPHFSFFLTKETTGDLSYLVG